MFKRYSPMPVEVTGSPVSTLRCTRIYVSTSVEVSGIPAPTVGCRIETVYRGIFVPILFSALSMSLPYEKKNVSLDRTVSKQIKTY